jgi:hypothetical protein
LWGSHRVQQRRRPSWTLVVIPQLRSSAFLDTADVLTALVTSLRLKVCVPRDILMHTFHRTPNTVTEG